MTRPDKNKTFRVLFRGRVAKKFTREQAAAALGKILHRPPASLAPIFAGEQKISFNRKPLDFQSAVKLKVRLLRLGLITDIEPWQRADTASTKPATTKRKPSARPAAAETAPRAQEPEQSPPTSQAAGPQTPPTDAPESKPSTPPANEPPTAARAAVKTDDLEQPTTELETGAPQAEKPDTETASPEPDEAAAADEPRTTSTPEHEGAAADEQKSVPERETVVHVEETPDGRIIDIEHTTISSETEAVAPEAEAPPTSETLFLEHPYPQPWWKRALTIPVAVTAVLLLALAVYWVYQLLVFTPSPGTAVVENHLATDDVAMIGLIDLNELKTVSRWIDVDHGRFALPPDLALFDKLGIDIANAVHSIVVSQHERAGRHPVTAVLLGDFDRKALGTKLETRYGAHADENNPNRLTITLADESGCERDLSMQISRKEIIVTSPDFIDEAYRMIHESFDGKPAMLLSWRQFRRHHPVSFSVFDGEALTQNVTTLVTEPLGAIAQETIDELLIGLDIAHVLTSNAKITARIGFTRHDALEAAKDSIRATSPLADAATVTVDGDHLEFSAPLKADSPALAPLQRLSLLGLCTH